MGLGREARLYSESDLTRPDEHPVKAMIQYFKDAAAKGIWINNYGTEQPVTQLSLGHLQNIQRMLTDGRARNRLCFLPIIQAEIRRRKEILSK